MVKFNPDRILALRTLNGLNRSAFARKVGVQRQLVEQWEKGETKPQAGSLEAICNAFGIEVGYFFTSNEYHDVRKKEPVSA